jgi:uracil-DNA glycosylase family 4
MLPSMQDIYENDLKQLKIRRKEQSFADAIFPAAQWCDSSTNKSEQSDTMPVSAEKKQVLESLESFATKKLEDSATESVNLETVSITKKVDLPDDYDDFLVNNCEKFTADEFLELAADSSALAIEQRFSTGRVEHPERVRIIFLSDIFLNHEKADNEFDVFFKEETADLFSRMVKAMKLSEDEFLISAVNISDDVPNEFLEEEMAYFSPEIIMTLGASASQKVLSIKQRLSTIHGNFYEKGIGYIDNTCLKLTVCPIFHPEFLRINPTMKKAAWADMQKVMKKLHKL